MYRYFETNSTDPCFNLAMEEYLLLHEREGDILMLWQNDNTIVIGRNQNAEAEINREYVDAHGVTVVRRTTGGGAVYHDLGNLNFSFITDFGGDNEARLSQFLQPMAEALCNLGLNAAVSGRNDITVEGKKVSGNAQRLENGRILHHGTLLFDSRSDAIAAALRVRSDKLEAKGIPSVKSRVGNIRNYLSRDMDIREFRDLLKEQLLGRSDAEPETLGPEALEEIRAAAEEKYRSWDWTYGKSGHFGTQRAHRFPDGRLEIRFELDGGRIRRIDFTGDYLSVRDSDEIAKALTGCRYDRKDAEDVLSGFALEEYFGKIRAEEIIQLLFYDLGE